MLSGDFEWVRQEYDDYDVREHHTTCKYETAFYKRCSLSANGNEIVSWDVVMNKDKSNAYKQVYLSRIWKKKGKHRYYITTKTQHNTNRMYDIPNEVFETAYCDEEFEDDISYESVYVGKNITDAIYLLFKNEDDEPMYVLK
jgi:hypothetical protein